VIKAVVFDVGETLVDETREYGTWADWLGIPGSSWLSGLVFFLVCAACRSKAGSSQPGSVRSRNVTAGADGSWRDVRIGMG
jgi:FMN phosphatase YigB (HAD superfamily)